MALPSLTPEERVEALEKALVVRRRRAEVVAAMKAGEMSLSQVLDLGVTEDAVAGMKVLTVLSALPGVGPARAAKAMQQLGVADRRRVRGLGKHQREHLGQFFA